VLLLFIFMGFGFSGYLLPWNKLSLFATKVGTEIAGVVPVVGRFAVRFLRGGDEVTGATLTRFFGFHIAVLPGITTLLLVGHLFLVQKHGMSVPPKLEDKNVPTMKFVPNFLLRDLIGWILAIGALAALSAIFPWELGEKADAFASAPAGIKPEWYFLFMFETLKHIPAKILVFDGEVIGVLAFAIGGLFWVLVPFLDREPGKDSRSRLFTAIGVVIVIYMAVMTVIAYVK
jgi:cytochrome b6